MRRIVNVTLQWDLVEHDDIGSIDELNEPHSELSDDELTDEAIRQFLDNINSLDNDGDLQGYVTATIFKREEHDMGQYNDPIGGVDNGPCNDFAPDTLGPSPLVCTSCFYLKEEHEGEN